MLPEAGRAEDVARKIRIELEMRGLHKEPLGVDAIELPVLFALQKQGIEVVDGQQLMQAARVIKTQDEITLLATACMMVDAAYEELYQTMKPGRGFKHTLEMSQATVGALVRDYVSQLADEGFKVVVLITGHYGRRHVETVKFNAGQIAEEVGVKVWALGEYEPVGDLGYNGDHAGKWETSIFWHLFPELVHMDRYRTDLTMAEQGVGGEDPSRLASPELGKTIVEAIVERIAAGALKLLEQARAEGVTYKAWKPTVGG